MVAVFTAIISIVSAIPIVDKWVQAFVAWYVQQRLDSMEKENQQAVKNAVEMHDQIELEKALGNSNAGGASGIPGVSERHDINGLPKP